ncbi:MAG: NAD(P)-dependent methylenetetrahydromethanopterin dehydrogenase [Candidatus Thorarchaeota archaeon]
MKTLELAPLKGKKLRVLLIRKAYDEPWYVTAPPTSVADPALSVIKRPSMAYCDMVKQIVEAELPNFVTDELGMRSIKDFHENNPLADIFAKLKVPYLPVEMDEVARAYLSRGIQMKLEKRNEVLECLKDLSDENASEKDQMRIQQLIGYGQYLHDELEEELTQIQFGIRESWITMGIMNQADKIKKKHLTSLHLSSPQHFKGILDLLQTLDVEVTPISFKQIMDETPKEMLKGMTDLTGISSVSVIPVIKRPKVKMSDILFFLETDAHASPFDICVAYDAGFDVVVPYEGVSLNRVQDLVQDAIFSRGTKGVKHTCFFVGGRQVTAAREMAKKIQKSMVEPFSTAVIADPHGAFSTSAAMVAKAEEALRHLKIGPLTKVNALVLAGTGPVGESAAHLLAQAGAKTVLTSRKVERAQAVAERLSTKDYTVSGIQIMTSKETSSALAKASLILATGAPGIQLISLDQLRSTEGTKILLDVNAIPPSGIESLKPTDELCELVENKYGIGALVVGDLKLKIQRKMLQEARKNAKGLYDDAAAFHIAQNILEDQHERSRRPGLKLQVVAT